MTLSFWRTAAAAAVMAATLATVVALGPATLAVFTADTVNPGNALHTAALAPPTSFTASCASQSRVNLSWVPSATPPITGYRIERRRHGESSFTALATVTGQTATSYADTASPFPSSLLVLGTMTVTYRIRAEVSGSTWRSPHAQASASGTVTSVLFIGLSFSCS